MQYATDLDRSSKDTAQCTIFKSFLQPLVTGLLSYSRNHRMVQYMFDKFDCPKLMLFL